MTVKDTIEESDNEKEVNETQYNWYIIQCLTNKEYRVRDRIMDLIATDKLEEKISRVMIPEEETIEIKNNKRVERIKKLFPGYVFLEMIDDQEIAYTINRIPGVAKFIGAKGSASPISPDEINKIMRKVGDKTKKIELDYEVGDVIKVIQGPFRGYSGPISEISGIKGKLKALISIFGRETPVELDIDQVEGVE